MFVIRYTVYFLVPLVQKSLIPFLSSKSLFIFLCSGLHFSTEHTKAQAVVCLSIKCPPLHVFRCSICKSCTKQRCVVTHVSLSCIFSPSLLAVFARLPISRILDDPSTPEKERLLLPGLCLKPSCRTEACNAKPSGKQLLSDCETDRVQQRL